MRFRLPFQSLFEQRTSLTDPHTFSSLPSWFGGSSTQAGVAVTEEMAEGLPTVFSCVRVIASAVAQLPLKLYRLDSEHKSEAIDHPLYEVLHDISNPEMTQYELRYLLTAHYLLWGNAYAEIQRNDRGEVIALWPLQPWRMRVDRDDRRRLRFIYDGGKKEWLYDPALPPIFRLHVNALDGITGRSVVSVLREAMGLTSALQTFGSTFFKNGSSFGGVLSSDQDLDEDQVKDIREKIAAYHQSAEKAHRFLVLGAGFKYSQIGVPPEDAQFLESRKFMRSELCGAYGVPPHMIADLDRATFSNIEHESLRWLRDGLDPHLVNWESAIRRDCLGPRSFKRYYARFTRAAAVRGDLQSRSAALATQRQNGVISANEWRALEEMDPISAADGGDTYIVNTAAQPTQPSGNQQTT